MPEVILTLFLLSLGIHSVQSYSGGSVDSAWLVC